MILITVGTHDQGFERLISEADNLVGQRKIKEKIIMQIGSSEYVPKNGEWFKYTSYKKMRDLNKKARIIVTHGGAGSILIALASNKPTIVVPRLKKFGEAVNDHQLDLVRNLEKKKKIIALYDIKNLNNAILEAKKSKKPKSKSKKMKTDICDSIEEFLKSRQACRRQ